MKPNGRNWTIVGLSPANTVLMKIAGRGIVDTGERPSEVGTFNLTRKEIGILRKGMTASGRDRAAPRPR